MPLAPAVVDAPIRAKAPVNLTQDANACQAEKHGSAGLFTFIVHLLFFLWVECGQGFAFPCTWQCGLALIEVVKMALVTRASV
jgi:hypothetical protein